MGQEHLAELKATIEGLEAEFFRLGKELDDYGMALKHEPESVDAAPAAPLAARLQALPAKIARYQDLRYELQRLTRPKLRGDQGPL